MNELDALGHKLAQIPSDATEAVVESLFIPSLLKALGFELNEVFSKYSTGQGSEKVDFAARHNTNGDIFLQSKRDPFLLIEVKGQATNGGVNINLQEGTPRYLETVSQIKRYLLSPKCKTSQWGIITNGSYLQLFRKHGRVVHPATSCLSINPNNIQDIVHEIRRLIENPPTALSICIYNNKGGIGKTTTTINLASTLSRLDKKVLVVDFDVHQRDLTNILKLSETTPGLYDCLRDRRLDMQMAIQPYTANHKNKNLSFDVISADIFMSSLSDTDIQNIQGGITRLRDVLSPVLGLYEYILIDTPPNWTYFSQSSIYAADVVLIPTRANDLSSLENSAKAISDFIPNIKSKRDNGGPIPLPIFFNGPSTSETQVEEAKKRLRNILDRVLKESKFNLNPYFFPKNTSPQKNFYVYTMSGHASVTKGPFSGVISTLLHRTVDNDYQKLAKEYFLE